MAQRQVDERLAVELVESEGRLDAERLQRLKNSDSGHIHFRQADAGVNVQRGRCVVGLKNVLVGYFVHCAAKHAKFLASDLKTGRLGVPAKTLHQVRAFVQRVVEVKPGDTTP